MTRRTRPQRIDPDFEKDMRKMATIRISKGLAKPLPKEISIAEMTRLARKTKSYEPMLQELATKPKKENLP